MSLEIVHGRSKNIFAIRELSEALKSLITEGTLYIGYPVLASVDDSITIDALLVTDEIGLIVFDIIDQKVINNKNKWIDDIQDKQDFLYYAVENNLGRHPSLRDHRKLSVNINIISYLPTEQEIEAKESVLIATKKSLNGIIKKCDITERKYISALNAAIQKVATIKPRKKRDYVTKQDSKGAILKIIEKEIANLDCWQKQAAIETPTGPQRVRGLAGSGKTIVLALKAAYLHSQYPDHDIVVTFHTRSLYQQFRDLIRRFTFENTNDEPNWDKIRILHAWGSRSQPGLYSEISSAIDYPVRDFMYGKSKFGTRMAFDGVCKELLEVANVREQKPLYDAILVDEAQDLPVSFFRLIYKFLKPSKQIIWAYDELQNLNDYLVPSVDIMFGKNKDGNPNVALANFEGEPHQDIILPVCYRNTPWALTFAHALGFGIYRNEGLVQLFDEDSLWNEIGYELLSGEFKDNSEVMLKRKKNSYPTFFENHITPDDAISCFYFNDFKEESKWIAEQVYINLKDDEIEYDDILIILPEAWTAKSKSNILIQELRNREIDSHLAGVSSSQDQIFIPESIAIANIYRAKGNEAPMVYVANADYCSSGHELAKLRNILFTAVTRSRAWVCLTGCGKEMKKLIKEYDSLKNNNFSLKFTLPDEGGRERLRTIHRDRTAAEKAKIKKAEQGLKAFIEMVEKQELDLSNLPLEIRERLERILGEPEI